MPRLSLRTYIHANQPICVLANMYTQVELGADAPIPVEPVAIQCILFDQVGQHASQSPVQRGRHEQVQHPIIVIAVI